MLGELDDGRCIDEDEAAERAGRRCREIAISEYVSLRTSVTVDKHVVYASNAFEYEFDGESHVEIPQVPNVGTYAVGLLVGPSGSGKSTAMRALGAPLDKPTWNE